MCRGSKSAASRRGRAVHHPKTKLLVANKKIFCQNLLMQALSKHLDIEEILRKTHDQGYLFVPDALDEEVRTMIEDEVARLSFAFGDHVKHPINKGTPQEVRQWHERSYHLLDDPAVPVGTKLCQALADQVAAASHGFGELSGWIPNEIGYQRYHHPHDWISPHRDRRSDQLLSVTYTVNGSAWMHVYTSEVDPPDYTKLTRRDSFLTRPGTAMFLRAPGFGSGKQVIHEVRPPLEGSRLIVNLRMRPTLLPSPTASFYEG